MQQMLAWVPTCRAQVTHCSPGEGWACLGGRASGPGPFPGRGGAQQPHTQGRSHSCCLPPAQSLAVLAPGTLACTACLARWLSFVRLEQARFLLGRKDGAPASAHELPSGFEGHGPRLDTQSGCPIAPKREEKVIFAEGGSPGSPVSGKQGENRGLSSPQVKEPGAAGHCHLRS